MRKKILTYIICFAITSTVMAQKPIPASQQTKGIIITNVKIHVGNGTVIENGELGFKNGKIDLVGPYTAKGLYPYDITIDGGGKHIYPGFILTNSTIGLREVDAVRSTLDYDEAGDMTPEVRAITTYNADSKLIPTIRFNGILIAQATPRGGIISGQSSVVQLDAWNWEDAAIKMEDGVHVNWPNRNRTVNPFNNKNTDEFSLKKERNAAISKIKDIFERSVMYMNETSHTDYNSKCEALKGLFTGTKKLYLHVNTEKDMIESVSYCESIGIKNIVLVGGYEAYKITDFIKQHHLSIILDRVHALPHTEDDDVKLPYKMAKILWDAGITCTFGHSGDMEVMGSRNLAFNAGTTVAYGLEKEQAVQMITLNAAKILGIDQQLGSIEVGKDATFFVSEGDALDMKTNQLVLAYINGRQIELENSQYYLYKMYMGKYGLKMK